jgi:hypothetical protein
MSPDNRPLPRDYPPDSSNRWLEKSVGQTNFETGCFTIAAEPLYQAPPANQGFCLCSSVLHKFAPPANRRDRLSRGEVG